MSESDDLWQTLGAAAYQFATEEDYAHGYSREVRQDLRRFLVFRVGLEFYGLPIAALSEVTKPFPATPVPRTADFVLGVGNVRGNVIPLLDLARRLRLPVNSRDARARLVIVRHREEQFGLLVDDVVEVLPLAPEAFETPPGGLNGSRGAFIQALARMGEQLLIILELDTLLEPRDFIASSLTMRVRA